MERLYVFILRNDVWIYILCALGIIWYANEFFQARRVLRRAMFGLEWETGARRRNNAMLFLFGLTSIASFVYFVNANIAPTLPPELMTPPTPTVNPLDTPFSSPAPAGSDNVPTATPDLAPTVTLAPQVNPGPAVAEETDPAVATLTITAPDLEAPVVTPEVNVTPEISCDADHNIIEPLNGAAVSGFVSFVGSASIEDFATYQLEINGPETRGQWASLSGRPITQPVLDGVLGTADLSAWRPGPYLVRLGVSRTTAVGVVAYCVIQVTLTES